jgi:hypothetical protein
MKEDIVMTKPRASKKTAKNANVENNGPTIAAEPKSEAAASTPPDAVDFASLWLDDEKRLTRCANHFRSTPESRRFQSRSACLKDATSGRAVRSIGSEYHQTA